MPTGLTRRAFAASLAAQAAAPPAQSPPRSNLLLVTNDQLRADCIAAFGNPVIRTPNLDRLAREGALFEQYFAQCPQCVPSRSSFHTGRYPHVNRTPTNSYRLPDDELTLAAILARAGYRTAAIGELPFAPTKFLGGFQEIPADLASYAASLVLHGYALQAAAHTGVFKQQFQAVPSPWPDDLDESAFFAAKAIDYIDAHRDAPFFLHVNFRRPHHPFDPPRPFDAMYAGADFPPARRREGEMKNKPPFQRQALENSLGFDLRALTARDLHRIRSYYYGMISENDKYIGRILDHLREAGLADRTVVAFNADHGESLGDHGLLFKGNWFYDEVVRVPLILRAPGKIEPGTRIKNLAEQIDLLPTLLELLDLPVPRAVQGRSLLHAQPRDAVHAEFPATKMLRTAAWKLVHYVHAPYGELYHLTEDPGELYNLYDDPAAANARHELESRLADWLIDSQDPLRAGVQAG